MFKLLRLKCFNCHKLRAPESAVRNITLKLALLDAGLLLEFLELSELMSRPVVRAGKEKDDASAEDGLGALNMADVIEKKRKEIGTFLFFFSTLGNIADENSFFCHE
jgi:hypothetical protein